MISECSPERTVSLAEQNNSTPQVAHPHLHHHPQLEHSLCPEQPAAMPVLTHELEPDPYSDLPEDLSKTSTATTTTLLVATPPPPSPPPVEVPRVPLRDDPDSLYNLTQLAEVSLLHPELHGCPDCGKR